MRKAYSNPSLTRDLGALAGLYRTVFWMMGRKLQYGRVWPDENLRARAYSVSAEAAPARNGSREKEMAGSRR